MARQTPPQSQRSSDGSHRPLSDSRRSFQYSPLDLAERSIRVIRVWPEFEDGMIACDIEHTNTRSTYRALSYTWGDVRDGSHAILINARRRQIGHNLWTFLCHARRFHDGRALWVDALCIDQDNVKEKNHQVKMMSEIYSKTEDVLVWLGPYDGGSVEYAMRRMRRYNGMGSMEMAKACAKEEVFWKGFKKITKADYWSRVWIIQEFIQPRRGKIIHGDHCVSFRTFENTARCLDRSSCYKYLRSSMSSRKRKVLFDYMANVYPLWQRRAAQAKSLRLRPPKESWPLLSGNRFCADIRDRVYGVLPLATYGADLEVDYHLNPFQLMLEAMWLEHDSEEDSSDILIALANILN